MKDKKKDKDFYYSNDYIQILNTGVVGLVSRFIHKKIDRPYLNKSIDVIEVGAGNGQHLALTKIMYKRYLEIDIRELNRINFQERLGSRVERMRHDATVLPETLIESFDLLIATCLIAHLRYPELALDSWKRGVRRGGEICIYVPCDPGIFLRLTRYFTTKRKFVRLGYDHTYHQWTEHRNHFPLIDILISRAFKDCSVKKEYFPMLLPSWNLNLFTIYRIKVPE